MAQFYVYKWRRPRSEDAVEGDLERLLNLSKEQGLTLLNMLPDGDRGLLLIYLKDEEDGPLPTNDGE